MEIEFPTQKYGKECILNNLVHCSAPNGEKRHKIGNLKKLRQNIDAMGLNEVCTCPLSNGGWYGSIFQIMTSSWRHLAVKNWVWLYEYSRNDGVYRKNEYIFEIYGSFIAEMGRFIFPNDVIWRHNVILMTSFAQKFTFSRNYGV